MELFYARKLFRENMLGERSMAAIWLRVTLSLCRHTLHWLSPPSMNAKTGQSEQARTEQQHRAGQRHRREGERGEFPGKASCLKSHVKGSSGWIDVP